MLKITDSLTINESENEEKILERKFEANNFDYYIIELKDSIYISKIIFFIELFNTNLVRNNLFY